MKKQIGLLFDFDGVILYSEPVHRRAWEDMAGCFNEIMPENFIEDNIGQTDEYLAKKLSILWNNKYSHEEIVLTKRAKYILRAKKECKPISGVLEFLKKASVEFPLALCTNSSIHDIKDDVKKYRLDSFFTQILTSESVEKPKPDPEIYILAAEKLSVPIKNCWIFEDSVLGVTSARASGGKTVGITTSYSKKELSPVVASFPDFLDFTSIWNLINN